jgi:hypothetical protein
MEAIIALMFIPLAVAILGKMRKVISVESENLRLVITKNEWIWKLILIAAFYLFLYYFFGYFIAWKNPAVRAYYGGTDLGHFFAQLASILKTTP